MRANCWYGKKDVRVETVPDPRILNASDAIVKVSSTAICGSDLHIYNGFIPSMQKGTSGTTIRPSAVAWRSRAGGPLSVRWRGLAWKSMKTSSRPWLAATNPTDPFLVHQRPARCARRSGTLEPPYPIRDLRRRQSRGARSVRLDPSRA